VSLFCAWVRIAQTCPLTAAQRRLVNPRAALRSVGAVVVVVACKAHAHRPLLFSLACGLRGALYYRKGTGCLYNANVLLTCACSAVMCFISVRVLALTSPAHTIPFFCWGAGAHGGWRCCTVHCATQHALSCRSARVYILTVQRRGAAHGHGIARTLRPGM
jgi:hypothetical protein